MMAALRNCMFSLHSLATIILIHKHFFPTVQLPDGEIKEDTSEVIARTDLPQRNVTLKTTLSSLSFALFDEYVPLPTLLAPCPNILPSYALADPTNEEEEIQSGALTIVYNDQGHVAVVFGCDFVVCINHFAYTRCRVLVSVNKPGGAPINDTILQECMRLAENRVPEVLKLIERASAAKKK